MNISNWIKRHAMRTQEKVALCTQDNTYTYAQFEVHVEAAACMLKWDLGVGKGDRVAFLSKNCSEFLITLFACARIGALFVPLNTRLSIPEHLYILQDADVKVLLLQEDFSTLLTPATEALPHCRIVGIDFTPTDGAEWHSLLTTSRRKATHDSHTPYVDLSTPLLIVYTSGTTGHPKGAVLTQDAVQWNAIHSLHMNDLTRADHLLTVLPLFHVGGINLQTLPAFYCGATVTLHAEFYPDQTLAEISDHRITLTCLVPSMMGACIQSSLWNQTDFSSLRTMVTGSTIVPQTLCDSFESKGVQIVNMYGATETCPIAIYMRSDYHKDKPTSIGLPAPHCAVRVVNKDGQDQPVGTAGEILIKGPNVMLGYWENEAATTQALRNGWYHTGDVGYCDKDGYYYICERKKNVIIKGGENIYPTEVERVLNTHPDIQESAVVGMPHPQWQEIPVAVLVSTTNINPSVEQLRSFLADKLSDYKIPHSFVFTDSLPKNAMGKIQHFHVREDIRKNEKLFAQLSPVVSEIQPLSTDFRQRILQTPISQQRQVILTELQSVTASALGLNSWRDISPEMEWMALGIGSLMLIQLRNVLMEGVGQALPSTIFFEYPTVGSLADYLVENVLHNADVQPIEGANTILPSDWPHVVTSSWVEDETTPIHRHKSSPTSQMRHEEYMTSLARGAGVYLHVSFPLRISSEVDVAALRQACQAMVDRHDAFRSNFQEVDGELIHLVHKTRWVDFKEIKAQMWTEDELQQQVDQGMRPPFDLAQDSLLRLRLFTRKNDSVFLIIFHHIIIDGTSCTIFLNELGVLYQSKVADTPSPLSPVSLSLVEYYRWLQSVWDSPAGHKLKAYWQAELDGLQPMRTQLFVHPPSDRLRNDAKQVHFRLDDALSQSIETLAQTQMTTPNIICLAAYMLLLSSYTDQDDVGVGTVLNNRAKPEFAKVIGSLENDSLIRVNVGDDPSVEMFLARVRAKFLDAFSHQEYNWKFVKEALIKKGHEIASVLYPFSYLFQQFEIPEDGIDVTGLMNPYGTPVNLGGMIVERYDLSQIETMPEAWTYLQLELSRNPDGVSGIFDYYSNLLEESTVQDLTAKYQELLAAIVSQPAVKISVLRSTIVQKNIPSPI